MGLRVTNHIQFTFADSTRVGVKAANVADMLKFGFPEGTIPTGFRIPFYLGTILRNFRTLYGATATSDFAMEIEFKVTKDGRLAIKQARPWLN